MYKTFIYNAILIISQRLKFFFLLYSILFKKHFPVLSRDKRRRDASNFRGGNGYDKNNGSSEKREGEIERQPRKEREKGREKGRLGNKMKPFRQI